MGPRGAVRRTADDRESMCEEWDEDAGEQAVIDGCMPRVCGEEGGSAMIRRRNALAFDHPSGRLLPKRAAGDTDQAASCRQPADPAPDPCDIGDNRRDTLRDNSNRINKQPAADDSELHRIGNTRD